MTGARPAASDAQGWIPLTAAQRGLFFAHELDPANPCYTTAEVVELDGPLDDARLADAVSAAYEEFEQLRVELRTHRGRAEQRVRPAVRRTVPVVPVADAAAAEDWIRDAVARPLDLARGELTRTALLRLPDRDWWWHAAHHVVLDGYGAQQLLRRVAELYEGAAPAGPAVRLSELADPEDPEAEAFWEARLAEMTGPASLAGHVAAAAPAALRRTIELDDATQRALVEGARRLGVPWSELFVAAVGGFLARLTGQPGIRVGIPLMNRTLPGTGVLPAARTVCTAMNVLPVTVSADGTLAETLTATGAELEAVRRHPWLRQEELTRRLGARGQLFGAQVNVIPFALELRFGARAGTVRNVTAGPVEDLTIGLRGAPGRGRAVRLELDANPALYPEAELDGHLERLVAWILACAGAAPDAVVPDLPLLTPAERELVTVGFNRTEHAHRAATLGARFAAQAARTPDRVALRFRGERRTYGQLDDRARRIAAGLRRQGVVPGDIVGVRLERGFALYEAIHALVLLGAVYLPIDPDLPEERIGWMREDAAAAVVIDDVEPWIGEERFEGLAADPDAPAYVLFTSGSTGRPKGVVVGHRAIDNRLAWMQDRLPLAAGDVVLHKTPISFDVSVWELFWPLQVGAAVEIAPPGAHRDPRLLAELLDGASVVHFVPSMLRAFLGDRRARERVRRGVRVVTSGEALSPDLVDRCAEHLGAAPLNLYGPTEAAVDVTAWTCAPGEAEVPIGRPIWNTRCYVLDARMRPVPIGAAGELWLGGVQLAEGYLGRPELTAERFAETGFGRLYRTGDLVSWRPDGALRYLGRIDDQVKVRGQRVELGEIESVVAAAPGVDAAAAGVVDEQLVCWYAGSADPDAVRAAAAAALPSAWIPQRWVPVPEIPLGVSGKVDRRALAALTPPPQAEGRAPASLREQRICEIVAEVLGLPQVAPDADLFALGADSLRMLRIVAALEEAVGGAIGFADAFAHPTAAGLAALLAHDERADGLAEILTLREGSADRRPLFLLPPAGGLGWCYTGLLPHLPADLPVRAIQAPGMREGAPEPVSSLTALARRQLAAIRTVVGDGGFHVAGWSLGGMAAQAVAALARADGQEVGAVVLLDAYPPEQWASLPEPTEQDALLGLLRLGAAAVPEGTALSRPVVAEALRASGSALAALAPEVLDGCIASVIEAARIVRTPLPGVLAGDAHLVVATAPRPEGWLRPEQWDELVAGAVVRTDVATTHGELVRHPEVGRLLAASVV